MRRYKIFFEREDGYLVEMVAYEKEFRDLELRILSAINTGLKIMDIYNVDNKMKKMNKSYFKQIISPHLSDKGIPYIVECYKTGKMLEIQEHMMEEVEKRIKADPPVEDKKTGFT